RKEQGKVLVHCKMGISRSASVVVAYAMKWHGWSLSQSQEFVKQKRTCVKPNENFLKQLEIYEGILDASKHRHNSLWRSVSESSLRCNEKSRRTSCSNAVRKVKNFLCVSDESRRNPKGKKTLVPPPSTTTTTTKTDEPRPKSWTSQDDSASTKRALRQLSDTGMDVSDGISAKPRPRSYTDSSKRKTSVSRPLRNVFWPFRAGESYSVSPNKVVHLDNPPDKVLPEGIVRSSSVKDRISELENCQVNVPAVKCCEDLPDHTGLVQTLANQFEAKGKSLEEGSSGQTYCAKVVLKQSLPRGHRDPFSAQVDKVFDREERRKARDPHPDPIRVNVILPPQVAALKSHSPSRQSSFGSVDSAIVVSSSVCSENPSRQSSWGSCDTQRVPVTPPPPRHPGKRHRWVNNAMVLKEAESEYKPRESIESSAKRRSASVPKFRKGVLPMQERKSSLGCLSKEEIVKCDNDENFLPGDDVVPSNNNPSYGTM
ncbi:unnamed protein product, partial [Notodromas monacha]